ncbi:hypothetical protein [Streptomyces thermolilacinus]|uniref:hypothetical protein n=1 Tax=Streptomyces thermolilacinus TaxID=285540 RepID=UPI0033FD3F2C
MTTAALGACSQTQQQREYRIPDTLCGVKVSADHLTAVLPPGKKITQRTTSAPGIRRCYVDIDDNNVLATAMDWRAEGTSLLEYAAGVYGVDLDGQLTADKRYFFSPMGGVGFVHCPTPSPRHRESDKIGDLFSFVRTGGQAVGESEMRALIIEYTEALTDSEACKGDLWATPKPSAPEKSR